MRSQLSNMFSFLRSADQKSRQKRNRKTQPTAPAEMLETRALLAAFTPGNLLVYQVGDGSVALQSNTGAAVVLNEFTPAGVFVQQISLNNSGAAAKLIASGTATSEGMISAGADPAGRLAITGYNATVGTASLPGSSSATTNRTLGIVSPDGTVSLSLLSDFATGNNPRSAVVDGNNFWVAGGAGSVRSGALSGNTATVTTTTAINTGTTNPLTNVRNVAVFNGQLYLSTGSGSAVRIGSVGTGEPTTAGQNTSPLPGLPTSGATGSADPYEFNLLDLNPSVAGVDTLYFAASTSGGVFKYSFDGTNWTAKGSVTTANTTGLATVVSGSNVLIYASTGTSVYTVTDTNAVGTTASTISGSATSLSLRQSDGTTAFSFTNRAFRGLEIVPDETASGAVTGLNGTTNYTAGNAAVVVGGGASFADLSNFKGGSLSIAYSSGGTANDTLSINNAGTSSGQIGVSGSNVTFGGTVIGTIDSTLNGANGQSLKVNFNAVSSANSVLATAVQELMRQVSFSTTSGASGGPRVITLEVAQNDGKKSAINAAATQTINVTASAGNQAPSFTASGPFSMPENSAAGNSVGTVTASDPDPGQTLTFSASGSGTGAALFNISSSGLITVAAGAVLDYETSTSYTFGVQVTDNGTPAQSTTATVTINLTNVNEAPVFAAGSITRTFVAGSANGTAAVGGAVTAIDPDAGDSVASYQIISGNGTGAGAFAISNTGVITVNDAAQVAAVTTFSLQITATDTFSLASVPKTVTVTVVNNNAPVFIPNTYTFSVAENSAVNTNVDTPVTATDSDSGIGDTITYSITAGNGTGSGAFKINSTTGQIQVNSAAQLDFETTPTFTLTLRATDSFGAFDSANVTINLSNVVESPTIPSGQTFSVVENSANGTVVGTVSATFDSTATRSFSITAGNGTGTGAFAISGSGVITIADVTQINYEAIQNHLFNLTIQATDTANSLSGSRTVAVNVTNIHEGTLLAAGDIVITGIDTTNPDEFTFVPLVNLAAGTEIRFTDNGWLNTGSFRPGEGVIVYIAPAGGISAGTEIGITNNSGFSLTSGTGTVFDEVGGTSFALNGTGDQITAFQGTLTSPTPLYAITTNRSTFDTDATNASTSSLPTGLAVGTSAVAVGGASATTANAQYNDIVRIGTAGELRSAVSTSANWTTNANRIPLTYRNFFLGAATTDLFVNEVVFNPFAATDTGEEYIELRGTASAFIPFDAYLVLLDGDAEDNSGNVDHVFTLGGMQFGSNGYLVLRQFGSTYLVDSNSTVVTATSTGWGASWSSRSTDIENEAVSVMLMQSSTAPVPDTDVDGNDDGTLDGAADTWTLRDAIGNIDGGINDTGYGFLNTTGNGNGSVPSGSSLINLNGYHPDYMARNGSSTGYALLTNTSTDWVVGELAGSMPTISLATGAFTRPAAYGGAALNHLGALNNFGAANSPPMAADDSLSSIAEDSGNRTISITSLIANDSDVDLDTLLITAVSNPVGGAVSIVGSNAVFVPAPNFNGPASFNYTLSDGSLTATAAVSFSITAVNDLPVANASSVTTNQNTSKTFEVADFLFTDVENDALEAITISSLNLASGDTLKLGSTDVAVNQTITRSNIVNLVYTPATNASGTGRSNFRFTVNDGGSGTEAALMTVNVTAVNTPPSFSGVGVFSVVENSTAVTTVTATDPDAGTTLTYSIQGGSDSARFSINPSTGALTFQSAPDFETPTDAGVNNVYDLTVGVSDGVNPVVTKNIAVTVTDINEALVESNVFYNKNALAEKNFAPGATGQRSMIRNVEIVFNGNVTIAPESVNNSSFVVTKLGTTTTTNIGLTLVSSSFDSGTLKTTVVLGFATASTLPSGSLSDGNYQLVVNYGVLGIDGNRVGQVGGSKTINFHRLFGDSDGDRDVDGVDNKNYTLGVRGATKWISLFDSDDDGSLLNSLKQDQEDKMAFFANFGRGI